MNSILGKFLLPAILITVGLISIGGCQTASIQKPPTGISVSNIYTLGKFQVPLPEGTWAVIGSRIYYNNVAGTGGQGMSGQIAEAILLQPNFGAIWIIANVTPGYEPGKSGYVRSRFCDRKDILFIHTLSNDRGGNIECWGINHRRTGFKAGNEAHEAARAYIATNNIRLPVNTVDVVFNLANSNDLLHVYYMFDPEARGFAKPQYADWPSSDWHRNRIFLDPKKVAFVEKLKTWGKDFHPKVKAGFGGTLVDTSTMRNPAHAQKPEEQEPIERKLERLQQLRNADLINDEEYRTKKAEILKGL